MNLKSRYTVSVLLVLCFVIPLNALGQSERVEGKLRVVSSTSIVGDVVHHIAGDRVALSILMGPSKDPHAFEPTPRDMARVEEADILFLNGFGLEEGLIHVLETVNVNRTVEVSSTISPHEMEEDLDQEEHHHGAVDPHTWMSPMNVVKWVDVIQTTLSEVDPENSSYYKSNAATYKAELLSLHDEIKKLLSSIPADQRNLVSDHKSLGYYSDEYDLKVIGTILPNTSTSADTSAKHLAYLIEFLKEHKVRAIFLGKTSGDDVRKLSDAVRQELGYDVQVLTLLSGSLQEEGEVGDSYLNYMMYNTIQIKKGLAGE
ncbi:MAG: hypothetical protein B6241_04355 [Spirochaetaceae bacterium 4572_59]|nr:MAG: hypothetical protein B6241_04355 [Spirochaetaceae bacterium 4572_59]